MTVIVRAAPVALVASLLAACGATDNLADSDGPKAGTEARPTTASTSRGPVIAPSAPADDPVIMGEPSPTMPEALVRGRVVLDAGCIRLDIPDVGSVVAVWPNGTRWDPQERTIVLDDGRTIEIGDYVEGGGGYYSASTLGQVMPTVLDRVLACLAEDASPETDHVVLAYPVQIRSGQPGTEPAEQPIDGTTVPPTTGVPAEQEVTGREEFRNALSELGVDVGSAPEAVFGTEDQLVCGAELLDQDDVAAGRYDEKIRRCFIDAHLAGVPAALASSQPTVEGDPIVSVWTTTVDGVVGLVGFDP